MPDQDDLKKVVFDTGIVLQATLSDLGPAFRAIQLLDVGLIAVFTSPPVRSEYEEVLTRSSIREKNPILTEERARAMLERLDAKAHEVTVLHRYVEYARDPDDDPILNLAIHVRADYLVARDKDLLDLANDRDFRLIYPFLKIVSPEAFLHELTVELTQEQTPRQDRPTGRGRTRGIER